MLEIDGMKGENENIWAGHVARVFINIGTRRRWVGEFQAVYSLYLGNVSRHLLQRRLGGPENSSEREGDL
jgi:hypothetical protein